eukprot:Phypoly_transcript_18544.p1 GENE.Phypoly_transcript_18544~~Phypoly_transcript_18544.p1  ORF type:complete len:105 (+),score=23.63 Phypoly_transcript_18544:347-661(+)
MAEAKQLSIKTNAVKRIHKEIGSYEKEANQQQEKVNKMKGDPKYDDHDIRKQEEVLAETAAMIPDAKKRLENATKDLLSFLEQNASSGLDCSAAMLVLEETGMK